MGLGFRVRVRTRVKVRLRVTNLPNPKPDPSPHQIRDSVTDILREKGNSFEHAVIYRVSVAAAPLAAWVKANLEYSSVLHKIAPLEQALISYPNPNPNPTRSPPLALTLALILTVPLTLARPTPSCRPSWTAPRSG